VDILDGLDVAVGTTAVPPLSGPSLAAGTRFVRRYDARIVELVPA